MKRKTIYEWLATIKDEGIRGEALANVDEGWGDRPAKSLVQAITLAFKWGETPQGGRFWVNVFHRAIKGKL